MLISWQSIASASYETQSTSSVNSETFYYCIGLEEETLIAKLLNSMVSHHVPSFKECSKG